ncbi:hypothetical protein AKO1_013115, partial [Acrasis kona]
HKLPHVFSKGARKQYLAVIGRALILNLVIVALTCVIVGFYVGSTWSPTSYLRNLTILLINKDGGTFGNQLESSFLSIQTFGWQRSNTTDYTTQLVEYHAWAALIIPEGFTQKLENSIFNNAPYQNNSLMLFYEQGRSYSGSRFLTSAISSSLYALNSRFQQLLFNNYSQYLTGCDPNLIALPIPLSTTAVNPVRLYGEFVASAFTILLIITLSSSSTQNTIRIYSQMINKVNIHQLLAWRFCHALFNNFILSLGIALVVLWYGTSFTKGWFWYWMILWLTMAAYGSCVAFLNVLCGVYTNMAFPAFLIISYAGSGSAIPLELAAGFFRYGIVLPMYHSISGFRYVIFGSGTQIGLNVGVLFLYLVIGQLLTYGLVLLKLWNRERLKLKSQDKKKKTYVNLSNKDDQELEKTKVNNVGLKEKFGASDKDPQHEHNVAFNNMTDEHIKEH